MKRVLLPILVTGTVLAACGSPGLISKPNSPTASESPLSLTPVLVAGEDVPEDAGDPEAEDASVPDAEDATDPATTETEASPEPAAVASPLPSPSETPVAPLIPTVAPKPVVPFETFAKGAFFAADTNHNGRLTKSELTKSLHVAELAADFHWGLKTLRGWDYATFAGVLQQTLAANPELASADAPLPPSRTPVLLVQGYGEPSYAFMWGIGRHLRKQGWQVYGINLFPNLADTQTQALKVEAKIQQIMQETGSSRINLVCHSYGGLISRRVIQMMGGDRYVDHLVTVATPHSGTQWCPGAPGPACNDMSMNSAFLNQLNKQPIWKPVKYASIWSRTDEIVIPAESAALTGSTIYPPVTGTEHLLILWHPKTYSYIDDALAQ